MIGRLDRYVALAVAGAYAAALLFLVAMFVVFDLLFEMDNYLQAAEAADIGAFHLIVMLAEYHLVQMPIVFVTIAPFVTVIASMFALSKLMAANEVSPMLFTGRSLFRILRPMLAAAAFSAVAMGATWQWVIPNIAEQHERLGATLTGSKLTLPRITVRAKDNPRQELFCREYDRGLQKMIGVIVYNRGSSPGDGIYLEAAAATWNPEAKDWELVDGWRKVGEFGKREIVPQHSLGMAGVTPRLITDSVKAQKQTSTMSYTELRDLIRLRPGKSDYLLAFHVHFTFPLANLVLVLLALPFAVNFERGRRIERVVFAILICAGYLVVDLICQNLAFDNYIHPIVAAWTPTIVFGSLGAVVFGGMRT
jgi:lipopolysaccharide export system permease protein